MRKDDRIKRLLCMALAILMLLVAFPGVAVAAEQAMDTRVKITLNPQSGTGGTLQIDVESGGKLPNITPPPVGDMPLLAAGRQPADRAGGIMTRRARQEYPLVTLQKMPRCTPIGR